MPRRSKGGLHLGGPDLQNARAGAFRKIRKAVGNRMDIMVELHTLWNMPTAKRIMAALEEIDPFWFEDPIRMNNADALAELARSTRVPITASEDIGDARALLSRIHQPWRHRHRHAGSKLDRRNIRGEGKVASFAEAHHLPIAPHDCTGPIVYAASVHLALNAPNTLVQESVRAFYTGWYKEIVTELPRIADGHVYPMSGAGLGTRLLPDLARRPDARLRRSAL